MSALVDSARDVNLDDPRAMARLRADQPAHSRVMHGIAAQIRQHVPEEVAG
ncbi:hypothetical protein [Cupriavidus necator]